MTDHEITKLADTLEQDSREAFPMSIDAMMTRYVPEMSTTHPCCPLTRTTNANCPTPNQPTNVQRCPLQKPPEPRST